MKHKIMFDIGSPNSFVGYSVALEFSSNKKDEELMRVAFKKLEAEMKRRGVKDYTIFYWWWLCTDNHWGGDSCGKE